MNVPVRMPEMNQRELLGSVTDCQFGHLVQQQCHGTGHSVADAEHELGDRLYAPASTARGEESSVRMPL